MSVGGEEDEEGEKRIAKHFPQEMASSGSQARPKLIHRTESTRRKVREQI